MEGQLVAFSCLCGPSKRTTLVKASLSFRTAFVPRFFTFAKAMQFNSQVKSYIRNFERCSTAQESWYQISAGDLNHVVEYRYS